LMAVLSVSFIVVSIVSFCMKTFPNYKIPAIRYTRNNSTELNIYKDHPDSHYVFGYIEAVCNTWFTFELLVRFVVAPSKCNFIRSPVNVIDFVALVSFYVDLVLIK
ncbi:hypothetical protein Ciccas_008325, partial [Cichlidogyrus casuarinus]